MKDDKLARYLSLVSGLFLYTIIIFGIGLYSGHRENQLFRLVKSIDDQFDLARQELPNLVPGGEPVHFLQPARQAGAGVTVNRRPDDGALILLAGFFGQGNELRLIRRDGTVVRRWPVRFSDFFPDASHVPIAPKTDWNVDLHGALIQPDGSVVFNFSYYGAVKLSRCGETLWTLPHPAHHSVEVAEAGGYWIPGQIHHAPPSPNAFPPFTARWRDRAFVEDLILRVSEDGRIVEQVSVPRLLYDNGFEPLLTATGEPFVVEMADHWDGELVHLNKIEELTSDLAPSFPDFETGDLALSLRQYNLLLVVDPDDWRVKWHQTGPWLRQHDPRFNADGTISLFNNNTYHTGLGPGMRASVDTPRVSNIMKVDPRTRRSEIVFGGRPGQRILTHARGKHFPAPGGGFLVTEFEAGRVIEFDAENEIVWEYINRYDADRVLEISDARIHDASYFTVSDWTCP